MTHADDIAAAILAWLASEPEMLGRFLALSGLDPVSLRAAAGTPEFNAGLIDFLMGNETDLLAFCRDTDTEPAAVVSAHAALSQMPADEDGWA